MATQLSLPAPQPFQWRYVAYAKAHGREPLAMLEHDAVAWPGGKTRGFVRWIGQRWQAWSEAQGRHGAHYNHVKSAADHASFDAWIGAVA
jgi:hypothetical protein